MMKVTNNTINTLLDRVASAALGNAIDPALTQDEVCLASYYERVEALAIVLQSDINVACYQRAQGGYYVEIVASSENRTREIYLVPNPKPLGRRWMNVSTQNGGFNPTALLFDDFTRLP